ncbi:bifunctional 2-polyprenyl-6-hydroxyphenol methylase/3-demethylubiquinol 3-O-methyltransferase UbiG [Saccharospirillum salsuginis]|uniref:Ubiquinone biosynthesis O-methyltransferase n=1 Tax=Saccharospirillum salsuginis TaxID=418750 RepID=A0A918NCT1_9GAMM|nr:bifunctional 2-polyprenyl-6-hydroxyphenol methylase/3-demethylubiquinol 3-O-methyltransferase UbiG [Saccharospirillum salsuginis]GGX60744.1 ubiquinone biosynthesis O-methyltransferase [Saccharospirillum salsuginis]
MTQNIDPAELAKFESLASRWWDPNSEFKPLHDINPARAGYIDQHINVAGKDVLDVGCGGGILTEALAQRGARVTGIDMTEAPLKVAQLHALDSELEGVTYRQITAESLAEEQAGQYDVITCLEMLEHVPDPMSVIQAIHTLLKPGGLAFFSTINRNPKAWAMAIVGAEYVLRLLPKGTHEYRKLIRPSELKRWAETAGLQVTEFKGMHYNPFSRNCSLNADVSVNYLMASRKPEDV